MSTVPHQVRVACFSLEGVARFLWSVAHARAVDRHTHASWVDYKESTVLNVIYTVMWWKEGPGTVEVSQNREAIRESTQTFFVQYFDTFIKTIPQGVSHVVDYLDRMDQVRASALESVQNLFGETQRINAEIIGQTNQAIRNLAAVKLGSTIILAGMTGGLAVTGSGLALAAGSVNLGYSVTGAVVKNWASLKGAGAMAIDVGKELLKEGVQQAATKGAETMMALGTMQAFLAAGKWDEAVQEVDKLTKEIARKVSNKKKARVGRKLNEAQAVKGGARKEIEQGVKLQQAGGKVLRAVPIVFAAIDIINAVSEYEDDIQGTR